MFIPDGGGEAFIQPYKKGLSAITLAMTVSSGSVVIEQMGPDVGDPSTQTWFQMVQGDEDIVLNSGNTARSIYAPIKLRVTATGTGVRMYNHGK